MASVSFHYSGDIVVDHKITIVTLSKTVTCLQNAINRAYLDYKYGGIWKHARISPKDYEAISFWVGPAQPGGYILDAVSSSNTGKIILDRISQALRPVISKIEKGIAEEVVSLEDQAAAIASTISTQKVQDYSHFADKIQKISARKYGDRSILKEFDEMLAPLRGEGSGKSLLELKLNATLDDVFTFNRINSTLFHLLVSNRTLAAPTNLTGKIDKLDRANLNGRFVNFYNNRKCTIYFENDEAFQSIHPYLVKDKVDIVASPILEYGTYDVVAGDLYFIAIQ